MVSALLRDGGATPWISKRYRKSLAVQNATGRMRDCLDCIEVRAMGQKTHMWNDEGVGESKWS